MAKKPKEKQPKEKHPTVGQAFKTGKAVEHIFEAWLPLDWLARAEDPDFHADYSVEIVENGEPTAKQFRAQVKGRTAKLKDGKIKESFTSKHLLYYLKSPLPVFIFRIDPQTGTGNWLFIQRYLKEKKLADKLTKQENLTIEFDPTRNLEAKALFLDEVTKALKFMADECPGSPQAALAAHKLMLEMIDPNAEISIHATDKVLSYVINPKDNAKVTPTISGHFTEEVWQALQSGQPVSLRASELKANMPILQHLLDDAGDNEITVAKGVQKMSGSAQVTLEGADDFDVLQVNGEWTRTPTLLRFEGAIPESPLHLTSEWRGNDPAHFGNPEVTFGFKISQWAGQLLLHLAHFDDFKRFFENRPLRIRFLARGQEMYRGRVEAPEFSSDEWLAKSIDWIGKLRQTATHFGQNPPFPSQGKFSELETTDVHVLVALATTGKCVQSFVDDTFDATGTFPGKLEPHPTELGWMKFLNQYKEFNFLGNRIDVGPFTYTWSDISLLKVTDLPNGQRILKWKGGKTGKLSLELPG